MRKVYQILLLLSLLVTACTPAPSATPPPLNTPQPLEIISSPALEWLSPIIQSCAAQTSGISLSRTVVDPPPAELSAEQIVLTLLPPADGQTAYLLGSTQLSLLTGFSPSLASIGYAQFLDILEGKISSWADLCPDCTGDIHLWLYPPQSELETLIQTRFLTNGGTYSPNAFMAASPENAISAARADNQALILLPYPWREQSLQFLSIDHIPSGMLDIQITAILPGSPSTDVEQFLLCLKAGIPAP